MDEPTDRIIKILEFKHIAPFGGCFHRFEYIGLEWTSGLPKPAVHPIVFTDVHGSAAEVNQYHLGMNASDWNATFFKDFVLYDWDEKLWKEIPHGYVPAFAQWAQEMDLPFIWWCDECGEPQEGMPLEMSGWRGNGGVGIEVDGWLCEQCSATKHDYY